MVQSLVLEHLPREQLRYQMVVQRLQNAISQGHLSIGDRLPSERELCEQLGVSRTIVREAIRVLASQGILIVQQGWRAVIAADLSAPFMRPMHQWVADSARQAFGDVMDTRLILEVAGAERAARHAIGDDIATIAAAREGMLVEPARRTSHIAFHSSIAHASHNLFLARMTDSLLDSLIAREPRPADSTKEDLDVPLLPIGYEAHARIFRPIRDHNVAAARRAMHEHLSTTIQHHAGIDH